MYESGKAENRALRQDKQRLTRQLNKLLVVPAEPGLLAMKTVLKNVEQGLAIRRRHLPPARQAREKQKLLDTLLDAARLPSQHERTITLQKRIIKHQASLLRFVDDQQVDFHNNH